MGVAISGNNANRMRMTCRDIMDISTSTLSSQEWRWQFSLRPTIVLQQRSLSTPKDPSSSSSSSSPSSSSSTPPEKQEMVTFAFVESATGNKIIVDGVIGKTVLDTAIKYDVDIEGACGGELACSTCHVIVPQDVFDKLPKKKEEEDDMLDLAWGLQPT